MKLETKLLESARKWLCKKRLGLIIGFLIPIVMICVIIYWVYGSQIKNRVSKMLQTNKSNTSSTRGSIMKMLSDSYLQYPFMAFIIAQINITTSKECSGTLINKRYILTAAHCLYNAHIVYIILGGEKNLSESSSKIELTSNKFIIHEEYNDGNYDNDIAFIELNEDVHTNHYINIIFDDEIISTEDSRVLGWGTSNPDQEVSEKLLTKNVELVDNELCIAFYQVEGFVYNNTKIICTVSKKGPCYSDSGGPLIIGNTQAGIVSAGDKNCTAYTPTRYMNVTYYRHWIRSKITKF